MIRVLRALRGFGRSRRGNVATIFALSVIPFMIIAGFAIDVGRAILVRERLGHALDAAILAVGAAPYLTEEESQALGEQFFHANFDTTLVGTSYDVEVSVLDDVVRMSARASVPTTLLGLLNQDSIELLQTAEAVRGGMDLELAMVLDNTGSMSGSKIRALRDAATAAVEIIFAGGGSEPDAVKIALVPFASTVNVGPQFERAWWLDEDAKSPAHHDTHTWNAEINRWDLFDELNVEWGGCVEARAEPYDMNDTPPSAGNPDTLFVPYFHPDEPGDRHDAESGYSNSDSWLSDDEFTRAMEPGSSSRGIPRNLRRLMGDGLPPGLGLGLGRFYNDENEARESYVGKYYSGEDPWGDGPNTDCIRQPIFPLSTNQEDLKDQIEAMEADGNTNIANGVAWGVRVLSPTAPFTQGRSYDDDELVKAMIVLTDGDNVMSGAYNHNLSRYNSYGYVAEGRFGIETSSSSTLANRLDQKTSQVCGYAKQQGIRVYSITFQVSSQDTRELMESCASKDEDGDPLYWNSPSTSELEQTFLEIARDLVDLRLTK